jgi:hypothetical protein
LNIGERIASFTEALRRASTGFGSPTGAITPDHVAAS